MKEVTVQDTSISRIKDVHCFKDVISNARLDMDESVLQQKDTPKFVKDKNGLEKYKLIVLLSAILLYIEAKNLHVL